MDAELISSLIAGGLGGLNHEFGAQRQRRAVDRNRQIERDDRQAERERARQEILAHQRAVEDMLAQIKDPAKRQAARASQLGMHVPPDSFEDPQPTGPLPTRTLPSMGVTAPPSASSFFDSTFGDGEQEPREPAAAPSPRGGARLPAQQPTGPSAGVAPKYTVDPALMLAKDTADAKQKADTQKRQNELADFEEKERIKGKYDKPPAGPQTRFWVNRDGKLVRISENDYRPGDTPGNTREQGRPVTSGDANRIADFDTSLDDLAVLRSTLTETQGATGTSAALGAALPAAVTDITGWGTDAKKRQGVIDRVKQVIGKALEGGVLRKEDEYKYEKILPTIKDTAEVAESKLNGLEKALVQRRQTTIDALSDAGYETSKFQERQRPATNSGAIPVTPRKAAASSPAASAGPQEGAEQPIPGVPGGVAKFTGGKWVRVK